MKHNFKKVLSIFLVAVMCFSVLPLSTFAEEALPACPECETNSNVEATGATNDTRTCTEAAGVWYVCNNKHERDGKMIALEFIKPYAGSVAYHSDKNYVKHTEYADSTCVATGTQESWYCGNCDEYYKSEAMVKGDVWADKDATIIPVKAFADKASHVLSANFTWKDGIEPVCGVNGGTKVWACTVEGCEYTYEETVEMEKHVWTYDSYLGDLSCTTEVEVIVKCECGAEETRVGLGWAHTLIETAAVSKTCTDAGNKAYFTCKHCGEFFMYATDVEDATDVKDMNCIYEENGKTYTKLVEVVAVEEFDWVVEASHEYGTLIGAVAETCTTAGNTAYYDCSECDKYFDEEKNEIAKDSWIVAATGHNVTFYDAQEPDCATDGRTAYYDCADCDLYFAALAEGDTAYDVVDVLLNGEAIEVKAVALNSWLTGQEAMGHDFEDKDAVIGNCETTPTIAHKYCAVCGFNYATTAGDYEALENALESINADVFVPNPDYNPYTDEDEEKLVLAGSVEGALDINVQHKWVPNIDKESTCDGTGVITWHCADCDMYTGAPNGETGLRVYEIPALNHAAAVEKVAKGGFVAEVLGTCVANGKSAYVQCPECSKYLVVNVAEDGTASVNLDAKAWDSVDASIFTTPKDPTNHAGAKIELLRQDATCTQDGYVTHYICLALNGCGYYYAYDAEGNVVNSAVKAPAVIGGGETTPPAEYVIPAHTIVDFVAARIAINCGDINNPDYFICSCGAYYGAKMQAGNLVVDYTVTHEEPESIRTHEYIFVEKTYNCGNDGVDAHYECKNPNCDKLFVKDGEDYVEVTLASLYVAATEAHDFEVKNPVQYCDTPGVKGVAGLQKCKVCGYEETIDPHSYIDIAYDFAGYKLPTCVAEGIHALKCDFCGDFEMEKNEEGKFVIKTYVSEKLPHDHYGTPEWTKRAEATCFEDGNVEYYTCNNCGGKFTSADMKVQIPEGEEILPATHKGVIDYVPVYACGTVYAEQEYCTICKNYSVDEFETYQDAPYAESVATHHIGNVMLLIPAEAPTCQSAGSKATYVCDSCLKFLIENEDGEYIEIKDGNDYIAPLNHEGTFHAYKAPTCSKTGNYAYFVCENGCGKVYGAADEMAENAADTTINTTVVYENAAHIIAALGHTQTNVVHAVPSVCDGVYSVTYGNIAYYVCDVCGKMFAENDTDADAVELDEVSKRAEPHEQIDHFVPGSKVFSTCTEVGYYAMQCECGYTYYKFTAPLQHKVTDKNETKVDPQCNATGLEIYYYCDHCDTYYKDAACTEAWGTTLDSVTIATLPHTNAAGEVIKATCDNGGFVYDKDLKKWVEIIPDRECQWCDYDGTLAHDYVSGHSEATCTTPLSDYDVCSVCGTINENTREVFGEKDSTKHGASEQHIKEGTQCEDSDRFYDTCKLCGEVVKAAYAGQHDLYVADSKEATCLATGYKLWKCNDCDYEYNEPLTQGTHVPGEWVTNKKYSDGKTNLYTVADAQAKYCTVANCPVEEALETRAMPDVNFSVALDNGVVAGTTLVNSGKLAVIIKVSAYDKNVNSLQFSFKYSNNLTFSHVEFAELANKFDVANSFDNNTYDFNDAEGAFKISSFNANDIFQMEDVNINGADIVYAVVYFDIASEQSAGTVTISDLAVKELKDVEGNDVDSTVGDDASADFEVLGDLDDDGVLTDELQAVMKLLASGEYNALADFDKDGEITVFDFKMYQKFAVSTNPDAYEILVSSVS